MISLPEVTHQLFFLVTGMIVIVYDLNLVILSNTPLPNTDKKGNIWLPFLLATFLTLWFGFRNYNLYIYGDSYFYAHSYNIIDISNIGDGAGIDWSSEWFFSLIGVTFRLLDISTKHYFTFLAFLYIFSVLWASRLYCPGRPMLAFLFIISSFSFLPFGLNGLRNGIACHLCLLAIALYLDDKRITAGIIAFLILGIHRSIMLPIAAGIAAVTVIRNPRTALIIWLASIPFSLLLGDSLSNLIMSIGFDDRMTQYAGGSLRGINHFSATGFRWDYVAYSSLPIAFYCYVNLWKGLRDGWYNVIATIYMLSNAFWIIVIRAEFSNRFAYLSWFLMPIMIAYPLANMKVVEWQSGLSAIMLTVYFALTVLLLL